MVSEHRVRERAYFIWEIEGRLSGRAEAHWLQAEAELTARVEPLRVEAVATATDHLPSPSAVLKPAPKKTKAVKAAAKAEAPKTAKGTGKVAAKTKRAASEGAALH